MIDLADVAALWELWVLFAIGGLVGYLVVRRAWGAFRAERALPMLLLATGLLVLTIGAPVAWTLAYLMSESMLICTYSASTAAVVGAALLLVSIQVRTT